MRSTGLIIPAVAVTVTGLLAGSAIARGTAGAHPPRAFSARFTDPQPNPYFPLTPGLVLRYRGTDGGRHFREVVTVTHHTKQVNGVKATVLKDILRRADGSLAEKTSDWYADDNAGNVWYLGEDTGTYDRSGKLRSREGSWQSGVKGAKAGLIMPASPKTTDAYRQEYWRGQAEDQAWIVQTTATIHTPLRTYHHVVRSYEWTRLEKHNVSVKFYAKGVGIASEHDVAGGSERFRLVHVTRP
jgi:hypothetical protein